MKPDIRLALAGLAAATAMAPWINAAEPLRLPNGEPLVCVYYFGHWWDPWKSDDDAIRRDFRTLRQMGFNTVCLDHEWSQAIDGDWRWLDREHRLAKEEGLAIIPWLSLKAWSDVNGAARLKLAKTWYDVDIQVGKAQDGAAGAPLVYDESVIRFGTAYARDYMKRYRDQALLHLCWKGGEPRPVICLGVESAWVASFDETTNRRFRQWLEAKYEGVEELNRAWGTDLASIAAVDPLDAAILDYGGMTKKTSRHRQAVEDHVEFRSQTVSAALGTMGKRVRETYPDTLLLAEIPYQYGSQHPHAIGYRIGYGANPSSCAYADIVMFRNTGPLNQHESQALLSAQQERGQRFILTYRTYSDWDVPADSPKFAQSAELYAKQAAELGSGIGFYSWNEMVDVHVAYAPNPPKGSGWTEERADRAIGLMGAMSMRYRQLVGDQ